MFRHDFKAALCLGKDFRLAQCLGMRNMLPALTQICHLCHYTKRAHGACTDQHVAPILRSSS
jgi:hypothetical protein